MSLWKSVLKKNFRNLAVLCDFLQLDENQRQKVLRSSHFPLNLPLRLAEKMQKSTLEDPLFRQLVPLIDEKNDSPSFQQDPVSDVHFRKEAKLLHKYKTRALLLLTSACAMNCRFCFRQNFPYEREKKGFEEELKIIADDHSLEEIILSGGDPLSLDNSTLKALFDALNSISHIKRIRIHTRFPIGIPERIDETLLEIFKASQKQLWFVIHTNHPLEIDEAIISALKKVQKLGIPILSQTVLLKGINDDSQTLKELFSILINHGFTPYYLHQLDKVQGAAHFEVEEEKGRALLKTLQSQLSGYAIPKYVKEVPFELSKTSIH